MNLVITLTALLLVATVARGLPKTCRGSSCRSQRDPVSSEAPSPAAALNTPPLTQPVKGHLAGTDEATEPLTEETETVTEAETETQTEAVTEEVRRVGVNGWLAAPTPAPATTKPNTPVPSKSGWCESPKGYGIKCTRRVDQCKHDGQCPDSTKCCLVGDCGLLCVKPKPTSTTTKEPTKEGAKTDTKKNKEEVKEDDQLEDLSQEDLGDTTDEDGSQTREDAEDELHAGDDNGKQEPQQTEEDDTPTVEDEPSTDATTEVSPDA